MIFYLKACHTNRDIAKNRERKSDVVNYNVRTTGNYCQVINFLLLLVRGSVRRIILPVNDYFIAQNYFRQKYH